MRLPRVRMSVRLLMALVLVLGGGLGWVVHRARVQRDAVAVIERAAGRVYYDWEWSPQRFTPSGGVTRPKPAGHPAWPRWATDALGVDSLRDVKKVILRRDPDRVMAHVSRLGRLAELDFAAVAGVSDAGLVHVRGLTGLEELRVDSPRVTGAGLASVRGLTALRSLSFCDWEDHDAPGAVRLRDADLANVAGLSALEDLRLADGEEVSDSGAAHLRGLVRLKHLAFGGGRVTSRGLAHLGGMTGLVSLSIVRSRVDDLSPIRHLTGLRTLAVVDSPLDDRGLAPVAGLVGLRSLRLKGTRVGDAGLAHLAGLPLDSLDVSGTAVTDAGLALIGGLTSLRFLDLSHTRVTDAGMARLTLSPLIQVNLEGTRVTQVGIAALRKDRPRPPAVFSRTGPAREEQARPRATGRPASGPVTFAGRVLDGEGRPVRGATIFLAYSCRRRPGAMQCGRRAGETPAPGTGVVTVGARPEASARPGGVGRLTPRLNGPVRRDRPRIAGRAPPRCGVRRGAWSKQAAPVIRCQPPAGADLPLGTDSSRAAVARTVRPGPPLGVSPWTRPFAPALIQGVLPPHHLPGSRAMPALLPPSAHPVEPRADCRFTRRRGNPHPAARGGPVL